MLRGGLKSIDAMQYLKNRIANDRLLASRINQSFFERVVVVSVVETFLVHVV